MNIILSLVFLIYFASASHNINDKKSKSKSVESRQCPDDKPNRCGKSWDDANKKCGQCCYFNDDCTKRDQKCYAELSPEPCGGTKPPTPAPTYNRPCPVRCGVTWPDANTQCGQCCTDNADCTDPNALCWADLDTSPCPTATTPTAAPTPPPTGDNQASDYRIPTISGCGRGKYVALTFDDGPANGANGETQIIIDKLVARGIVATFYVSPAVNGDDQPGLEERCVLIQELVDAGMEIQSHSWSHPDFASVTVAGSGAPLSNAAIKQQLDDTRDEVVRCGGVAPTIFRPPYGSLSRAQAEYIARDLGYILGLWNLDSNDWRDPNDVVAISGNIDLSLYGEDSVTVLMHDRSVYAVLDDIIDLFDGYEFITQSECFARCDTMDNDGVCVDSHGFDFWIIDTWRN